MNRGWIRVFSIGIVFLLVLTAASGIASIKGQQGLQTVQGPMALAQSPDSFVEATIGGPQSLDPAIDYETAGGNVLQNVYETLLWYDGNTTILIPWLATKIPTVENSGISPDGLNYTFTIRSGVMFHDGSTMNAGDVVFSIQRALKMHDASGPVWMIQSVLDDYLGAYVGTGMTVQDYLYQASTYNASWIYNYLIAQPGGLDHVITQADEDAVADIAVRQVGTDMVNFRLTHVYPGFLSMTAYTIMDVLSKSYTQAHPDLNYTCMGTGPYKLVSWEMGASVHLQAWTGYWGTKANIPDVYILEINDVNTRLAMLQSGSADYIYLPIAYAGNITGNPDYLVDRSPTLTINLFVFNYWMDSATSNSEWGGVGITDDFFQNVHMRLAFEYLFNASLYIQNVAHGNALPLNGVIPKGLQGYNASTPFYSYDLAMAESEMRQVPNPNQPGKSFYETGFTIPLFFNAGNLGRQVACQLLKQGLEALHAANPTNSGEMDATVNSLDWGSAYLPAMYTPHNFMSMYMVGWGPDYADPDDYAYSFLHTGGAYPLGSSYNNSTINDLVLAAGVELDMAKRTAMYEDLSTKVHSDPPYIFVDQPNSFLVFRSWITGEYSNPMWSDMYYAILSKEGPPGIEVVKKAGSPSRSAISYDYAPANYGTWTGHVVNDGLRSLVVEVDDVTTGAPESVMSQRINFKSADAYPVGAVDTRGVIMSPAHAYRITLTPNGPTGTSAVLTNYFVVPMPPIASFAIMTNGLTVTVDGSSSYDLDGTVVAWAWDWGDGSTGSGSNTSHVYVMAGEYGISLTVMDDSGLTASTTQWVYLIEAEATLSPPYSDHGVDTDADSLFESLAIDVPVEVSVDGIYWVYVYLYDSMWNYIASSSTSVYLGQGLQTVEVLVKGSTILLSGIDGPYVVYINLADQWGYWLGSDMYTTQAYRCSQFDVPFGQLVPPYSDYGLDTDGDGLYDYLVVNVTVSVRDAGYYIVDALLSCNSSGMVNWTSTYGYFEPGLQTVQIEFIGFAIRSSGCDGPYQVSLQLRDSYGVQLDNDSYITQAYSWSQFQHPDAEFVPPYTDYGLDINGDGLYDYLVIKVTLMVSVEGSYRLTSGLCDGSRNWLYIGSTNVTFLEPGLQTINVWMNGTAIYSSGVNGPYYVWLSLIGPDGYWLQDSGHYTQAYPWDQFQPPVG